MTSTLTNWEVYVIQPAERTNLVTNPVPASTTGYTAVNSTLAADTTYPRYGSTSLKITPSSTALSGAYYSIALTDTVTYTFSVSVKGKAGITYTLAFVDDTGSAVEAATKFTANGNWQRRSVTFTADETDTFYLQVQRDASQDDSTAFYTAGWQLEAASTASTFISGNRELLGMLPDKAEYYWTGAPNASTSVRVDWTQSGGTLLRMRDYCTIIAMHGAGMPQITPLSVDITTGGEIYQWSRPGGRQVQLVLDINGDTPGDVAQNIAILQAAFDTTKTRYNQPIRLMFVGYNEAGTIEQSDTVLMDVAYISGFEGSFTNYYHERLALTLEQYDPAMQADGYTTTALDWQDALTGDCLVRFTKNGTIDNFGITSTATGSMGHRMVKGINGEYYLGGVFTDLNGIAEADNIAKYTASGGWAAMASGVGGGVYAAAVADDGTLYIGGAFTNAGGDAAADRIAKWNGMAFSAVGTAGANSWVQSLAISRVGHLYVGGDFTDVGGSGADKLARWDGSSWNVVGSATALNAIVYSIIPDPWGDGVIIGGAFTNAGGDGTLDYLARVTVSGSTYAYTFANVGGTAAAVPNDYVHAIYYDETLGRLYIMGKFTAVGSVAAASIAYWDGANWNPCGSGLTGGMPSVPQQLTSDSDGNLYAACNGFRLAGGISLPDSYTIWRGNQWHPVKMDATSGVWGGYGVYYDPDTSDLFWLGQITSSTVEGDTSVTNSSYSDTDYLVLTVTGPGKVWGITNYTTNEVIDFNNLTLLAGETMYVLFGPTGIIRAYAKGGRTRDLRPYLVSGNSPTMHLAPGANKIGMFIYGSTSAATTASLSYRTFYRSLEQAVY